MPLNAIRPRAAWVLFALGVLAVAGVVHIVTVLALPIRAKDDAFARIAAVVPVNTKVVLRPAAMAEDRLPFRDPAMITAVCRFDLSTAPFRLSIEPFDHGFVSVGVHSRLGVAFYGLNVQSIEQSSIDLLLMTPAQKQVTELQQNDEEPGHDLQLTPPSLEGFITIDTPSGEGGDLTEAEDTLSHVRCASATMTKDDASQ